MSTSATETSLGTAGTTTTESSTGGGDSETGGPIKLCDRLEVSLVIDPNAPVLDEASRTAMTDLLDDLVTATGAAVRVLPNAGTEQMLFAGCTLGLGDAADGPVIIWGKDFAVHGGVADALRCNFDALAEWSASDGNWMFSGLMFPILELPQWPAPDAVGLAVLLAEQDDGLSNMYSRPGMASEAYIRLVGGGDRRRVATLTMGQGAEELELFALSLGDKSTYADFSQTTLAAALAAWKSLAIGTCADHDYLPPPRQPAGCEHLDILFVIDGSASMAAVQKALRGIDGPPVFKEFTDVLIADLDTLKDFHIGVVSSQPGDTALHTHTDQPMMSPTPDTDCGLPQPWIVGPSPTLEQDFACIGATKADTIEVTAFNAAQTLHDGQNGGFLRNDSVLFVVMMTDEDTQDYDFGTQVEIRNRILAAVDDDLERVLVLGIAGGQGVFEMPHTICNGPYGNAVPARRLSSIVMSFREHGIMQDICGGELAAVFADVVEDVVTTCKNFHPEG